MTSAYFALSAALVALGLALSREAAIAARGSAGIAFLFLAALGIAIAAFFQVDVGAARPLTTEGWIHRLAAILGFVSLAIAPLLLARCFSRDAHWHAAAATGRVIGAVALAGFIAMQAVLLERGVGGIAQRVILALVVAWLLLVAFRLTKSPDAAPGRRGSP